MRWEKDEDNDDEEEEYKCQRRQMSTCRNKGGQVD